MRFVGHDVGRLGVEAMEDIASGLAGIPRDMPGGADDNPSWPRTERFIAADLYDVWLVTWPPGSRIRDCHYGSSSAVVCVAHGSLAEMAGGEHRLLRPGRTAFVAPWTIHRLWNPSTTPSSSVHVFSPALGETTRSRIEAPTHVHPAGSRSAGHEFARGERTTAM